jgi:diaminohydroxyphosphoribosylaminopyrimidine deaminase/5-amino-6-(5-phosphoribosylamino)uracil reductase
MAAAIRLSRWHLGRTGTNPSVATLIVKGGVIVGRGITAIGGRPHAETQALAEAGGAARGAAAYVTLEPCAHHGRTPPCAEALITAGIARVVGAASDPDSRVSGKGYAMLRAAGITVVEDVLADRAADVMSGYLNHSVNKRPEVILKLAVSANGMVGAEGSGQVAITGPQARAQSHLLRATCDAILIGIGTALADDPHLTCRTPGLENRSPIRIVLDANGRLPAQSAIAQTARITPLWLATGLPAGDRSLAELIGQGVDPVACEIEGGHVALPELLDDLGARGIMRVLVEGGAAVAGSFLGDNLVDRIALFSSPKPLSGPGLIAAPITRQTVPSTFRLARSDQFGEDRLDEYVRA